LPHGWDAGVLFEETQKTLFCSDLFHHVGDVEPLTTSDVVGRSHQSLKEYQAGILAAYVPYTPLTAQNLKKLADLKPKTLAIMHGSSFTGDGAQALYDLDVALRDLFGPQK
jgi:flavorubredoxin